LGLASSYNKRLFDIFSHREKTLKYLKLVKSDNILEIIQTNNNKQEIIMAEINVKSPQLKDRDISTYEFVAKITLDGSTDAIDIAGLTVLGTTTGFTLSGFEAESDLSLDASRDAAVDFMSFGTVATAEEGAIWVLDAVVSGTAGSRIVTFDVNVAAAAALDLTSDSITDAQVKFYLPIKAKDF